VTDVDVGNLGNRLHI